MEFFCTRIKEKGKANIWKWHTHISLPELSQIEDKVSAINYLKSDLIYIGTVKGKVYQLKKVGKDWKTKAFQDSGPPDDIGLPPLYIWDIVKHCL